MSGMLKEVVYNLTSIRKPPRPRPPRQTNKPAPDSFTARDLQMQTRALAEHSGHGHDLKAGTYGLKPVMQPPERPNKQHLTPRIPDKLRRDPLVRHPWDVVDSNRYIGGGDSWGRTDDGAPVKEKRPNPRYGRKRKGTKLPFEK